MINLKKEHEAFNAEFKRIGREYSSDLNSVGFNGILSANELGWLACAESKQAEIDSLKAQLAKFESSEYLIVKKEVIENWYLDEGEYVWYEKDSIDGYLEDLDNGEVLEVQRKEYVVINSNPVFATNVYEDADNIQWELFDSKDEAEKAAAHCKAMIEAAQEQNND